MRKRATTRHVGSSTTHSVPKSWWNICGSQLPRRRSGRTKGANQSGHKNYYWTDDTFPHEPLPRARRSALLAPLRRESQPMSGI
jgi:hypothetical protein